MGAYFNYYDYSILLCRVIFIPKGLTTKKLKEYHALAYEQFYFRPSLILRHLKYIRSWSDIKRYWLGLKAVMSL